MITIYNVNLKKIYTALVCLLPILAVYGSGSTYISLGELCYLIISIFCIIKLCIFNNFKLIKNLFLSIYSIYDFMHNYSIIVVLQWQYSDR